MIIKDERFCLAFIRKKKIINNSIRSTREKLY